MLNQNQRGEPLTDEQAAKLRAEIATRGVAPIARALGVAIGTVTRAAATAPLYASQRDAISRWLASR